MSRKGVRITYWISTLLFVAFMLLSGVSEIIGVESGNELLRSLGYPLYLNIILGIGKILGVVAIIQTKWKTIKEWAYAGFSIDLIGASLSFVFIAAGFIAVVFPLIFLAVMFVSYATWKKLN